MTTRSPLKLYEEVLLLALRDREGTLEVGSMVGFALGGALLAELLLSDRIRVAEPRPRRKLVEIARDVPLKDELLDECLAKIRSARRRASVTTWVTRFSAMRKLRHRVARGLCRRNVLRADEDKVLLFFTRRIYPEIDPRPEREILERLRAAIFSDTSDVAPRTVVLASLAHRTGLLKASFGRRELKARKARLEQLGQGEVAGGATKQAIEAMQAAVMVACIVPVISSH